MCLDRLTVKRTLKKKKTVFKVIVIDDFDNENFLIEIGSFVNRISKASSGYITSWDDKKGYKRGFHCFVKKSDALKIIDLSNPNERILSYIIPKETTVQYGFQDNWRRFAIDYLPVIVTPTLINPRIK